MWVPDVPMLCARCTTGTKFCFYRCVHQMLCMLGTICTPDVVHVVSVFTDVYTKCCACWGLNARLTMRVPDALISCARCTTRTKFCFYQCVHQMLCMLGDNVYTRCCACCFCYHRCVHQMLCMLGAKCSFDDVGARCAHVVCQMHNQNQVLFLPMCTPDVVHVGGRCGHQMLCMLFSVFTDVYTRCCACWGLNARSTMWVPDALTLCARCTARTMF